MPARALIIGIENYPAAESGMLANTLPGTLDAALKFKEWLLEKWRFDGRAEADTQLIFCSEPPQQDGRGASREDILQALLELKREGRGATSELFFFFSGHGFAFVEKPGTRADVIISSDFKNAALSGQCCLNLDQLISWLRDHMGPGRHYYFVDACRNRLNGSQVTVGTLLPSDTQVTADASTYLLQSTVDGAVAAVGKEFPATLLAGLRGKGTAKVWDPQVPDAMVVKYESLLRYMREMLASRQRISNTATEEDEKGSGVILASIKPIPSYTCTVDIKDATAAEIAEIGLVRNRTPVEIVQIWTELPAKILLEPDHYSVVVRLKNGEVVPATAAVDLFEDRSVVFKKIRSRGVTRGATGDDEGFSLPLTAEEFAAATLAEVDMIIPPDTNLKLRHLETGEVQVFDRAGCRLLSPGNYAATLRDVYGALISRRELALEAGGSTDFKPAEWQNSPPHLAIGGKLPPLHGLPDFSEQLGGAVADLDLNLWLALLGGGRILGSRGDYSKLAQFPLHDFLGEPPGAAPVYILAGFDKTETNLSVALSSGAEVSWREAREPSEMSGIREAYFDKAPSPALLSFRVGGQAPYTIATLTMPNRATLITFTLDEHDDPQIGQYILPLGHLIDELPAEIRQRLEYRNQLQDVRFLALASRAFRQRHTVAKEVPDYFLVDLLAAKWLDPIGSTLAAYELIRRGNVEHLPEVIGNLRTYFPTLPDTAALAALAGETNAFPEGFPLFFDGLKAFPDFGQRFPLPASHLDFNSPWTAWRAAVRG